MSFSNIAIEQREKEVKALKSFLAFSTIASLVLHLAVLAAGIGNLFVRTPELEEEAIELTLVEPEVKETPAIEELKEEKLALGNNTAKVLTSSGGSAGEGAVTREVSPNPVIQAPPPVPVRVAPVEKSIEKSVEKPIVTPVQKFVDNFKPQPLKEDPVVSKEAQPKVEPQTSTNNTPKENTPTQSSTSTQESSENLRDILGRIRGSRNSEANTGNLGSSSPNSNQTTGGGNASLAFGKGTGTGTGTGNSTGTSERRQREIATAPTQPNLPTTVEKPERSGNPNGSLDGRAACRNCKVKYSESARRRGSEGRVEVAVDTDKDGNVTNVRVVNSSGDRDLDAEHIRQAREWKLKPSDVGRQGVKIATEYSIEGSRRNRQVRERQKQREEQQRQRQVAASSSNNNSSEATPRRQRRLEAAINNTDVTTTSRRRRNFEASSNSAESRIRLNNPSRVRRSQENSFSDRLRRNRTTGNNSGEEAPKRKREVTADVRTSGTQVTPTRRRRRNLNQSNQSPNNGSRLRDALRRSREVVPATVPASEGNNSE
ncbi:energy transducer TonB [Calothrix sp. UHCC 0171]|uniref:energy transducer TonB n=1 Tax=Calothrix sp. UHCC 0171 TaxID=3110245 RepID=UPI002B1E99D6|nr:energy transducer TonB [Calothrix sp. UHCC 0171]MEA5574051.1 energy transducer TonB [Calothrix sp. UHCC 0171]